MSQILWKLYRLNPDTGSTLPTRHSIVTTSEQLWGTLLRKFKTETTRMFILLEKIQIKESVNINRLKKIYSNIHTKQTFRLILQLLFLKKPMTSLTWK